MTVYPFRFELACVETSHKITLASTAIVDLATDLSELTPIGFRYQR